MIHDVLINNRRECSATALVGLVAIPGKVDSLLRTGDALDVVLLCASAVTAVIETNRGTVTYTLEH
jgi:hypothetical protein